MIISASDGNTPHTVNNNNNVIHTTTNIKKTHKNNKNNNQKNNNEHNTFTTANASAVTRSTCNNNACYYNRNGCNDITTCSALLSAFYKSNYKSYDIMRIYHATLLQIIPQLLNINHRADTTLY